MLEPPAQRNEHEEHGRRFEEGFGRPLALLYHGNDQYHQGVGVRDAGCHDDQHVHVGRFMLH